jgi:hypothetical protein
VLCVGWPGIKPATFKDGEKIQARYGVWIHRGVPEAGDIKKQYETFSSMKKIEWPISPAKP